MKRSRARDRQTDRKLLLNKSSRTFSRIYKEWAKKKSDP